MVGDSPAIHLAMEASRPVIPLVELSPVNRRVILPASRGNPTVIQRVGLNLAHLPVIHQVGLLLVIQQAGHSLVLPRVIHLAGRRQVIRLVVHNLVLLLAIHLVVLRLAIHLVGRSLVRQPAILQVVRKG